MELQQANEYFSTHLDMATWDGMNDTTKTNALIQARRQLEAYRRKVPSRTFLHAVCEQALWLLNADTRSELQGASVTAFRVGDMSEQFDTKGRPSFIAPQAWTFLSGGGGIKMGQIK